MTYLPNKKSVISTLNTTIVPLSEGETWSGSGELNDFPDVMVSVNTDIDGTLYCEFSHDGINWDTSLAFHYDASRINPPHILVKGDRYYRTRFTNTGPGTQDHIRLHTDYGTYNKLTAPLNGTLGENYDAQPTRPSSYQYEVAEGKRQGSTTVNKFGHNDDIDTGADEIIAYFGGAFHPSSNIINLAQPFDIGYTTATDGSGTTGATVLLVTYLDGDFLEQSAFHTLSGTGLDTTTFSGLGINRALVYSNGGAYTNTGDIVLSGSVSGGTQAVIPGMHGVTQQCIFHVQIGHNLLIDFFDLSMLKISGGGVPTVTIKGWSYSRFTNTLYAVFEKQVDTAIENNISLNFAQPFVVGGRDVVYVTASTTVSNTKVSARFSGVQVRVT